MLEINQGAERDDSISSIKYHSFTPYTQSYEYQDEIRIRVPPQNSAVLLNKSNLHLELRIDSQSTDSASHNDEENPNLGFNYASFLFDLARYELNGIELDRIKNVGITSTLKILTTFSASEIAGLEVAGLESQNQPTKVKIGDRMSLEIPLSMWFGLFEDVNCVILNSQHELILQRSRNDVNCFVGGHNNVKIHIEKLSWRVPHVKISDGYALKFTRQIPSNKFLPIMHRSFDLYDLPAVSTSDRNVWAVKTTNGLSRPRYIILAFSTNRLNRITGIAAEFDAINLTEARVYLNNEVYPAESQACDFSSMKAAIAYNDFKALRNTYYEGSGKNETLQPSYGYKRWMKNPVFVFDLSRQDENVNVASVDVRIEFQTKNNVPEGTSAFCLILCDCAASYEPWSGKVKREY